MSESDLSPLRSTADILILLATTLAACVWVGIAQGADNGAAGWTWRCWVLLALLPLHAGVVGWRLVLSRGDPDRRWTVLGASALTTIVLLVAIFVGLMALSDSWL